MRDRDVLVLVTEDDPPRAGDDWLGSAVRKLEFVACAGALFAGALLISLAMGAQIGGELLGAVGACAIVSGLWGLVRWIRGEEVLP